MKKNETKVYEAPQMKVLSVELEQGIAAASVAAGSSPALDDWTGGAGGTSNGDF